VEATLGLRRRFALAVGIGAGIGFLVFLWFLVSGPGGLVHATPYGVSGFYDQQARALFHGHWDAGPNAFFIERFDIGGRYYMYFGPWPSLLRMPVLAATSSLDGDLTGLSLLLAYLVLFTGASRLVWQVRTLARGAAAASRRELVAVAAFMLLVACGSTILFLSSSAWVYDEAVLWGCAWGTWALTLGIAYLLRPGTRVLVLATIATIFAITTRVSTGAIGVVLLGSLFVLQLLSTRSRERIRDVGARLGRVAGIDAEVLDHRPWPMAIAAALPVAIYSAINWVKFGSLFSVPWDKQDVILQTMPQRRHVLAANGSQLVSLREIPTNLLAYLRPDAVTLHPLVPFVDFSNRPAIIGGVARDVEGPTVSFTVSTTLLLILAVVGLAVVLVPRVARRTDLGRFRMLRVPVLAAAIAFVPTLVFQTTAERYKADLTPLLVVAGGAGVYGLVVLLRGHVRWRAVVVGLAVLLFVLNVFTNLGLTTSFQRGYQRVQPPAVRGRYLQDQIDWTERLGIAPRTDVVEWHRDTGARQPKVGRFGTLLVVDDCTRILRSDGTSWLDLDVGDPRAVCRALGR